MKHVAQIQTEFAKEAISRWENLSYESQKAYLRRHPKTKRRVTMQPIKGTKRLVRRALDKFNSLKRFMNRSSNKKYGLNEVNTRERMYSILTKAIKGKDVKLLDAAGWGLWYENEKDVENVTTQLNNKVRSLIRSIKSIRNQLHRENMKKIKEQVEAV